MTLTALVDGDLVAYRCAATSEEEDIVLFRANELMERIISDVGADSFCCYLSGDNNFRKEIDPEYKANRKDKPRPTHLQSCREFLVTQWKALVTDGIEADDALGMAQREDTIICTLDKDLLMVPGRHYNWVKGEERFITPEEGLKHFWSQMLIGDVADNVRGVDGIGVKKAAKLLDPIEGDSLEELDRKYYDVVSSLYNDPIRMHRNAKVLWIMQREADLWLSPEERNGQREELSHLSQASYEVEADVGLQSMSA